MFYKYDDKFYDNLKKPDFQPPKQIFKYIWTILFILMFISLILVLLKPASTLKYTALAVFAAQLALNLYWTKVFFAEHRIKKALTVAITLTVLVLIMIILFFKLSFPAGYLQIPYLLWLAFAVILNKAILDLNQ